MVFSCKRGALQPHPSTSPRCFPSTLVGDGSRPLLRFQSTPCSLLCVCRSTLKTTLTLFLGNNVLLFTQAGVVRLNRHRLLRFRCGCSPLAVVVCWLSGHLLGFSVLGVQHTWRPPILRVPRLHCHFLNKKGYTCARHNLWFIVLISLLLGSPCTSTSVCKKEILHAIQHESQLSNQTP